MALLTDLITTTRRIVDGWATAAQQQACRNAMVAGTALAQARAQRVQVEEFLAARIPSPRKPVAVDETNAETPDPEPTSSVANG